MPVGRLVVRTELQKGSSPQKFHNVANRLRPNCCWMTAPIATAWHGAPQSVLTADPTGIFPGTILPSAGRADASGFGSYNSLQAQQTGLFPILPEALSQETMGWRLGPKTGGQGRIRTSVARKGRQVYSLLPLATRPPVHCCHPRKRESLTCRTGFGICLRRGNLPCARTRHVPSAKTGFLLPSPMDSVPSGPLAAIRLPGLGAGDGNRTRDQQLGRLRLYH